MSVTIKFVGAVRSFSSRNKIAVAVDGATPLRETIKKIVKELPKLEKVLVDPELENSRPNTLILINRKEISILDGLDTLLRDGDEVVFVPVVHGG